MVRQLYDDALAESYLLKPEGARTHTAHTAETAALRQAILEWRPDHADQVLCTAVVDQLFCSIEKGA
jgi:hypothetical protein